LGERVLVHLTAALAAAKKKRQSPLIPLVGAARFELTTPSAQGRFRRLMKIVYSHALPFQGDAASLLRFVESYEIRWLRHLHFHLNPEGVAPLGIPLKLNAGYCFGAAECVNLVGV
jgi:hypothetical protein